MDTQSVDLVSTEYRKINIGQIGSFVNRSLNDVYILEAAAQPSPTTDGDPTVAKRRYHYDLATGQIVWGRTIVGNASLGVTPE
jgi:hypothetical protein